ncbi:MAG: polysaccharide deacetylase family protein [Deltaproteobacteria bacterium]|nr:polysaccharide deacetylase family protein [Deltaproteobacteria bacterium]MDQ3301617.1 polysaccharide deacetylase family protein [Myxococcota bacterium]
MKRCAVSIDLDGLPCYYRIHGLGRAPVELEHVILERALPRAAKLFSGRGMHVTWFVVGRDADADAALPDRAARTANAARLRELSEAGDELGNHSYSHPYELARLDGGAVDAEIAGCDRVLRAITGKPPRGFRAPGYDLSPAMLDSLARRGYRYDSSIFPAPGYYAAKAAVMAALALVGRPSGAVMTNPRALSAPPDPYRPAMAAPWRRGQAPLVELPVAVTPWARLPAIGTSLLVAPAAVRSRLIAAMAGRAFFNFELHGIDFADAERDGIPGELVARQPDLRVSVDAKLARLEAILDEIARTWSFATLAEVAADVQRTV